MTCNRTSADSFCSPNRIATYADKLHINLSNQKVYKVKEGDSIGTAIKKLRLQKGLTTRQLSNLTGLKLQHINEIERESVHLSHKTIRALYTVFKDDLKIDPYTKYVLSDANIRFCEYIKKHNINTTYLCRYFGLTHDAVTHMKLSTNITYKLFKRVESKLEEMGLLEE